jgi:hypothetical protein
VHFASGASGADGRADADGTEGVCGASDPASIAASTVAALGFGLRLHDTSVSAIHATG